MNNAPSRRERIRLSRNEKKLAYTLGTIPALIVLIVIYSFRLLVKVLFRTKKQLYKLALIIFMIYSAYAALLTTVVAPKAAHALDGKPAPTPYIYTPTQQKYIDEIYKIWGSDANVGIAIASCESGINADEIDWDSNGTADFSVFQVNSVHGYKLDPEENIQYAYSLYKEQGTTPWNSSKSCWSKKI